MVRASSLKEASECGINFTVLETQQCPAEETRVRIVAQFDADLLPILEILFLHFKNVTYSRELKCIVKKKEGKITSIFGSGKVSITYLADHQEGIVNLNQIAELISKAFEYLSQNGPVEPSLIQQHENLNALEIVKLLPQTNCGECGESGCFTFATRLLLGEHEIDDCSELLRDELSVRKGDLSKLLQPINLDRTEKQLPSLSDLLGL